MKHVLSNNKLKRTLNHTINFKCHHVCVVGSGPSGIYVAKYLTEMNPNIKVDVIEKLPTPYGSIILTKIKFSKCYGVAPDHESTKNVMSVFKEIFSNENIRFIGNVSLGSDISIQELRSAYSAVVLATGAQSSQEISIGNKISQHKNVIHAREFISWYNGLPGYDLGETVKFSEISEVIIIGNGNVALDCARIILKKPQELMVTDIVPDFIENLKSSSVKNIHMIGRRSHVQSAFAIKELREVSKIPYINLMVNESEKKIGNEIPNNLIELSQNRPLKRKIDLINCLPNTKCEVNKNLILRFLLNPCAINTKTSDERVCQSVSFEKMTLQGEVGSQKAVGLRSYETIPCQLVIVSTGYSVIPLAGEEVDLSTQGVKNSCGRIPNQFGLYCTGWYKRGPKGIIGTNIPDAKETALSIIEDLPNLRKENSSLISRLFAKLRSVSWKEYMLIENEEIRRGQEKEPSSPRSKIISIEALLKIPQTKIN